MSDGPATKYARAVSEWRPIDWWKLEARALNDIPALRRALAFFAPPQAWKSLSKDVVTGWGILLTLTHIASFTLPVLAALALVGWLVRRDDLAPVGAAGILAGIAAVIGGIGLVSEHRTSPGTDPKIGRLLGALHLVPSAIATVVALLAIAQDAAAQVIGIAGILADVGVGVLHFVFNRGPADDGSARWRRNFAGLERARAGMTAEERTRVHSDLQQALLVLRERNLIADEELHRAGDARIGTLGMSMAPRKDLSGARTGQAVR